MKSCESCIFATATHGRFKTTLADGMTLTQNGGVNGTKIAVLLVVSPRSISIWF